MNSNTLLEKLDKTLSPIGAKIGEQESVESAFKYNPWQE